MQTRPWEIYSLNDPITQEVRYIGVTFRRKRRFNEHMSRAITGGKTYRDAWIRSLIAQGLRPLYQVLEHGQGDGWQDAEIRWIATYRRTSRLVNHCDGGEGLPGYVPTLALRLKWSQMRKGVPYAPGRKKPMLGRNHTPEAIEKIRAASLARRHTPKSRLALSKAHTGKTLSAEHREKLSKAHTGKTLSAEHIEKIAASTTNRKPVVCIETGEVFPSITAIASRLNVHKSCVTQAIRKGCRCKGLHWKFQ